MPTTHDHDVIDLSASQVETFKDCHRKWAFGKIDGIYMPGGPAAELGGAVHKVREDYLTKGSPIDIRTREGQIAIAGIKDIPLPMTADLEVEGWFDFYLGDELHFRGRIDYRQLKVRPPVVGDHKTTSDFKWAKSSDDLYLDVQANIYVKDTRIKTGAPEVDCRWHYMTTGAQPQSRTVRALIGAGQNEDVLGAVREVGLVMLRTKKAHKRAIEVEYTASACGKYGGCAFAGHCNLTNAERASSVFGGFRDIALAEQGTLHQHTATEDSTMDAGNALLNRLNSRKTVDAAVGAPAALAPAAPVAPTTPASPAQAVNPPEAPPPPPSPLWDEKTKAWIPPTFNTEKGVWEFPQKEEKAAAPAASAEPPPAEGGGGDLLARAKRGRKPAAAAPATPEAPAAPAAAPPTDPVAAARAKAAVAKAEAEALERELDAAEAAAKAEEARQEEAARVAAEAAKKPIHIDGPYPAIPDPTLLSTGVIAIDYARLANAIVTDFLARLK